MTEHLIPAAQLRLLLNESGAVYSAGRVRYPGDCTHIVGEIKGSTTYGTYLAAVNAEYDAEEDRTHVAFVQCPMSVAKEAVVDEFGTMRIRAAS